MRQYAGIIIVVDHARPELLRADLKGWLFKLTEGVSIDDYSTYRATRFSEPV